MRRRDFLRGLAALGTASRVGASAAAAAAAAGPGADRVADGQPLPLPPAPVLPFWGINTDIKFAADDDAYRRAVIALARDLRMGFVREAVYAAGGLEDQAAFDWRWLDRTFDELADAGLGCALALRIDDCRNPDGFGPAWERNVRYRVRATAERYGRRVLWYTPWNEPDMRATDVATVVRAQEIVHSELKQVDPALLLESAPLATPRGEGGMMLPLCEAGITRFCDFLGCHLHNGVHDDSRNGFAHAWRAQRRAAELGFPVRPISLSENGYGLNAVRHPAPLQLKAHWAMLNLVQVKRYGIAQAVIFTLATPQPRAEPFALVDAGNGFALRQPAYAAYQAAYNADVWAIGRGFNGGFEEPQADKTGGWVVHYDPLSPGGDPGPFSEWDRVVFRTDGAAARTGRGYCRMVPGGSNKVRRLVEGLTPGRPYTLTAWVRPIGAGAATLAAMGHNRLDGLDDRTSSTDGAVAATADGWVELRVAFRPSNPWVVIGLENDGRGVCFWDDVTLT